MGKLIIFTLFTSLVYGGLVLVVDGGGSFQGLRSEELALKKLQKYGQKTEAQITELRAVRRQSTRDESRVVVSFKVFLPQKEQNAEEIIRKDILDKNLPWLKKGQKTDALYLTPEEEPIRLMATLKDQIKLTSEANGWMVMIRRGFGYVVLAFLVLLAVSIIRKIAVKK